MRDDVSEDTTVKYENGIHKMTNPVHLIKLGVFP